MDSLEGMDFQRSKSRSRAKALGNERLKFMALDRKPWTFTYEALTHVHSLRLFLFNSLMPVPWRCVSLHATLAPESSPFSSSPPVVLCEFKVTAEGEPQKLFVPLPVCLVDYSASLVSLARSDHIEIKLKLLSSGGSFVDDLSLLGYTYRGEAIERDGGVRSNSPERDESAFSLTSDTELLTSNEGVTFHCRNCSAKLTNQPISCFRALPSAEWRELADHWFGMCCCRDGVKTKSMMVRFEEFSTATSGVCLVGSTTCIVHRDDLVSSIADQNQSVCRNEDALCTRLSENDAKIRPAVGLDVKISCKGKGDGYVALSADQLAWVEELKPLKDAVTPSNVYSHNAVEESVESATCCSGHGNVVLDDDLPDQSSKTETLANGFMSAFPSSKLIPFYCHKCADLIGVFCGGTEGLQLFKCHVSSDLSTGGPSDIFRFHTLERVFSNELFSNAEEDSSYRYVVRDLSSRLPLLQLVLINHESWVCSGLCVEDRSLLSESKRMTSPTKEDVFVVTGPENETIFSQECELKSTLASGESSPVFLEPVMKLMFCDTSSFNAEQLSEVESWGQKNQSDDIYMLGNEVKALSRLLQVNRKLFPESCAAFQQFQLSFLAR